MPLRYIPHAPDSGHGSSRESLEEDEKMDYDLTRPYTWVPPEDSPIGKRGLRRKDGYEKASGTAIYAMDIDLDRTLYAKFHRSPYSQADIISMDTSAAEALPGVTDIIRYDDPDISHIKHRGRRSGPWLLYHIRFTRRRRPSITTRWVLS